MLTHMDVVTSALGTSRRVVTEATLLGGHVHRNRAYSTLEPVLELAL